MTLLLMLLACGDKEQAEDSAVEETQQHEAEPSEPEDTSSGENEEDTGGEA